MGELVSVVKEPAVMLWRNRAMTSLEQGEFHQYREVVTHCCCAVSRLDTEPMLT